jgi:hypothetical protein
MLSQIALRLLSFLVSHRWLVHIKLDLAVTDFQQLVNLYQAKF